MTTKNKDSLKGILKDIEQERRAESAAASKLKVDNRKALQELEDKGWNRAIITPTPRAEPDTKPVVAPLPKKKVIVKKKPVAIAVDKKDIEITELKKQLTLLKTEAIEKPE